MPVLFIRSSARPAIEYLDISHATYQEDARA